MRNNWEVLLAAALAAALPAAADATSGRGWLPARPTERPRSPRLSPNVSSAFKTLSILAELLAAVALAAVVVFFLAAMSVFAVARLAAAAAVAAARAVA
jgi:hypothetical protein